MKLDKINDSISDYLANKRAAQDLPGVVQAAERFNRAWSFETDDFLKMFDLAIDEEIYYILYPERRLPYKTVMLEMIKRNPVALRQMFLDLFYERVDIKSRVDHFIMECDENFKKLLHEINTPHSHHLHKDFKPISIYLFLNDHHKYGFTDYPKMVNYLKYIQARNIPDKFDFENQLKMLSVLTKIIMSNDDLQDILSEFKFDFTDSLIVSSEIIRNFKNQVSI